MLKKKEDFIALNKKKLREKKKDNCTQLELAPGRAVNSKVVSKFHYEKATGTAL